MANDDATRLAVLIDADNSTASVTKALLDEVATYGTPTVKRAYGDWTTSEYGLGDQPQWGGRTCPRREDDRRRESPR